MAARMLLLAAFMLTQAQSGKSALVVQKQAALVVQKHASGAKAEDDYAPPLPTQAPMYPRGDPHAPPMPPNELGNPPTPPVRFGTPGAWWKNTNQAKEEIRPSQAKNSQITVIINMLQEIKYASQMDLYNAHKAYDKAACMCQDQLATAMESLGENKEILAKHRDLVIKYSAEIGSLKASTKQLAKDIKEMKVALKENDETRKTESAAYVKAKFNLDENIRSMTEAVAILAPPAATTTAAPSGGVFLSFLSLSGSTANELEEQTRLEMQDRLMSVRSQLEPIVTQGTLPSNMQPEDVQVLKNFLVAPQKLVSDATGDGTSELQVDATGNPSAQIDGIMKAMLDGFQADLKKAVGEESDSKQSYESLKLSKSSEKFTFEQELQSSSGTLADKTKDMAASKVLLDKTAKADASDKEFFETTKDACKEKARMWSIANRMRTEEIAALDRAMYQLGADYSNTGELGEKVIAAVMPPPPPPPPPAQASGAMMLLQEHMYLQRRKAGAQVFSSLKALALKAHSVHIALVAIEAKESETGVFDKLLPKIDDMIAVLRKEEQDDIKKRDYCENTLKDIQDDNAELTTVSSRTNTSIVAKGRRNEELEEYILKVTDKITHIKLIIGMESEGRKKEKDLFLVDTADKQRAFGMMGNAIKELKKGFNHDFLQIHEKRRTAGKPPSEQKEEQNTVISMLEMIRQDIDNEIEEDKLDDAANQKTFEKKIAVLKGKIVTHEALRTDALKDKAANDVKTADLNAVQGSTAEDVITLSTKKTGVDAECAHLLQSNGFANRRSNRKVEMQGLSDAKNVLAGGLPTL